MKKIILAMLFLLLAFYVGWPLWSAYKIHAALEANDAGTLATKVDFPAVRASLKPTVTSEVERALDKAAGGVAGQLLGGLKQQLAPQLVETILNGVVTPQRIGEFYQRRGDIKDILAERMARRAKREAARGSGGPATEPAQGEADAPTPPPASTGAAGTQPRPKLGFANLKRLAFTGPLSFEVGVARDANATAPDVVAQLGFEGFDWKLVGLVPRAR